VFESITEGLTGALDKLTGRGRLTESNIDDGIREVRRALLTADVNIGVVKRFIASVKEKAVGEKVIKSVDPGQQIVKIVHDELTEIMGEADTAIARAAKSSDPSLIMMLGLQGAGKTTSCGKLARMLKQKGHRPLLVAADVQRPAAIEQLKQLGLQLDIPVYAEKPGWLRGKPAKICQRALKHAQKEQNDFVILDTAGRLAIDEELMSELKDIKKKLAPHNTFLVCDAMTGQDAVNSAKSFNDAMNIDGVILTKMDGDARGGAALSIRAVTGKPIKFIGVGEKLDKLKPFHPERMAQQILGMGDIVSLVERAQEVIDQDEADKAAVKLLSGASFTFDDFLAQLEQVQKLGPMKEVLGMLPGIGKALKDMPIDDKEINRVKSMVQSMTSDERKNPKLINQSRRRRIARGSGHKVDAVSGLIKEFQRTAKVMQGIGKMPGIRQMFGKGRRDLEAKIQAETAKVATKKKRRRKGF
jgi:signal recognition particle subunit SRP54